MFSMQRYARRKENQKRLLEDKKKKLQVQEADEKSKVYPMKGIEGGPKKRVQKN